MVQRTARGRNPLAIRAGWSDGGALGSVTANYVAG